MAAFTDIKQCLEEEQQFEEQYSTWKQQFNDWKEQNKGAFCIKMITIEGVMHPSEEYINLYFQYCWFVSLALHLEGDLRNFITWTKNDLDIQPTYDIFHHYFMYDELDTYYFFPFLLQTIPTESSISSTKSNGNNMNIRWTRRRMS